MNVSAIIPTRGDVNMQPIRDSLPKDWEVVIWDNDAGNVSAVTYSDIGVWRLPEGMMREGVADLGPHARFAAIEYASNDLIYVQDDDVIVSDPQAIVDALLKAFRCRWCGYCEGNRQTWCNCGCGRDYNEMIPMRDEAVVCNMPQEFRPHYPDSAMVGFGAAFHRDAPERAFQRFFDHWPKMQRDDPLFLRESCRIFTTLMPRVLVDVAKEDMPYASDDNRLWKQGDHVFMREAALKMAREVRDQ